MNRRASSLAFHATKTVKAAEVSAISHHPSLCVRRGGGGTSASTSSRITLVKEYSPFYRDIGFPFPSPVHALISDGWVQPSQPTPTPTLSSSLSGCLLAHAMSGISSLTVPIALSAVAMFLLYFWNELLGIGVEDKTHRHRLTQPAVHLPSRAGLLSTRVELV